MTPSKGLIILASILSLVITSFSTNAIASDESAIGDIELVDHFGEPFTLQSTQGKVALVLFGYTSCPDVCPMGLTIVSNILNKLGPDADKLTAMFISVDPLRDTPDVLQAYVSWFHKDIIGLTGSTSQIDTTVEAFSAQYSLNRRSETDDNYAVDHSSGFYLIDFHGKLKQIVPFGLPTEHTLNAIRNLIAKTDNSK